MGTFAAISAKPGVGIVYLLDVSTDDFATTSHRWATHHILVSSNQYEARIIDLGNVSRELGAVHSLTGATVEIQFDNTDAVLDWLVDRTTFISTTLRAVFKLTLLVFDPQNPSDTATQVLGKFSVLDNPKRDTTTITLQLVDDVVGRCMSLPPPPSLYEAESTLPGVFTSTIGGTTRSPNVDRNAPLPLWFGAGPFMPTEISRTPSSLVTGAASASGTICLVCCVVGRSVTGAPTFYGVVYDGNGHLLASNHYTFARGTDLTKNGRTYHVIYLYVMDTDVGPFRVYGTPFSQVTNVSRNTSAPIPAFTGVVHPASVAQDLLTTYAADTSGFTIDTASFDLIRTLSPTLRARGSLAAPLQFDIPYKALSLGEMQQALQGLALVGHFDLVVGKTSAIYAKVRALDFASITTTPTALDEELMKDVQDFQPSVGERNALVTRYSPTYCGTKQAPIIDNTTELSIGRVLEQAVDLSWLAPPLASFGGAPYNAAGAAAATCTEWGITAFDPVKGRPMLTLKTSLPAAALELGDYVSLAWTRGNQHTAYATSIWRVEGWTLNSMSGLVELKLLWCDEFNSGVVKPFLLDDPDSYAKRAAGSGGRTITVTNASNSVAFSSGSLVSDGVAAGDILVVQDPTEAATTFKRNRALLISGVTDATHLTFDTTHCSTDFGSTTSGISAWTIYRGALTYPTALSDPTNYPNGSSMYGKISDSTHAGKFSDNSTIANTLQDG